MSNEYAINMKNVSMIFNGTIIANDSVNLDVKKGDIHALIGENGAGKSTLMSILFGLYEPTIGEIMVNGKIEFINNPIKANKLGIGMVHQHFKLINIFKIWENIVLGDEMVKAKIFVDKKSAINKITEIMNRYNLQVDLESTIDSISVGMQQRVEILKILYRDANILVFDEPTAILTPQEIDGLLEVMRTLQKSGKTIIFITHKLAEIKAVANKATVIRRGKVVDTFDVEKTSIEKFAEAMVGRKIEPVKNSYKPPLDENILEIENLTMKKASNHKVIGLEDFNLNIRAGEIVAIAGVEGNGQRELVNAVTGMDKVQKGKIIVKGKDITNESIAKRYRVHKISHIPEDRHKYAVMMDENVINNMVLQDVSNKRFSRFGFLNEANIQAYAQEIISKYDVRGSDNGFAIIRNMSGGNQQKAVVGREITREHNLLVVVQPTRGLDIGSIEYIHNQILRDKEKGRAVLLVSYELSEVMSLADRIYVVNGGKLIGEVPGKSAKREEIGLMMTGQMKGVAK